MRGLLQQTNKQTNKQTNVYWALAAFKKGFVLGEGLERETCAREMDVGFRKRLFLAKPRSATPAVVKLF